MIIKGKSRAAPAQLAAHLGNAEKNERVTLLETRGTIAQNLRGSLVEMQAFADGTRCEKPLYHAAISPAMPHRLTPEQRAEAVDALEQRLGFDGHARVVVMHEKLGRQHIHVVWSRIDLTQMKSISDSHNYRRHEEVARDLERRFGHERVQGAHHEREGVMRPERTLSAAELRQQERTGVSAKKVKEEVTEIFRASDGPNAFRSALAQNGYTLATGDRRDYVIIDRAGGIHSLARRISGVNAGRLRAYMHDLAPDVPVPSIKEVRERLAEERAVHRKKDEAHHDAVNSADYARGEDYVTQTKAAQEEFERRQRELNKNPRPNRPENPKGPYNDLRTAEEEATARQYQQDREQQEKTERESAERSAKKAPEPSPLGNIEMTDAQRERFERFQKGDAPQRMSEDRDDWDPDRQREAPGGGRTRGR